MSNKYFIYLFIYYLLGECCKYFSGWGSEWAPWWSECKDVLAASHSLSLLSRISASVSVLLFAAGCNSSSLHINMYSGIGATQNISFNLFIFFNHAIWCMFTKKNQAWLRCSCYREFLATDRLASFGKSLFSVFMRNWTLCNVMLLQRVLLFILWSVSHYYKAVFLNVQTFINVFLQNE